MFIVGKCTFWSNLLIVILFSSFLSENYLVQYGGNALLQQMFFLCLFFPINKSFVTEKNNVGQERITNISLTAIQLHILIVYLFAGINKIAWPEWRSGFYVYKMLSNPNFTLFNFSNFFNHDLLINFATYFVLILEVWGVFLLFTEKYRKFALIVFIAMHLCFEIFINVHLFNFIMIAVLTSFLKMSDIKFLKNLRCKIKIFQKQSQLNLN
jgi:hypothetical protein